MASADLDARLKAAVAERDRLSLESQRIIGRKEAAERSLKEVEDEIRQKNLDPDTLDETVLKLEAAFEASVTKFEEEIKASREALLPFQEKRQ